MYLTQALYAHLKLLKTSSNCPNGFNISCREVIENFGSLDFVELIYLLTVTYVNVAFGVNFP